MLLLNIIYNGDVIGVNHYYGYRTRSVNKNGKIVHIPIKYVTKQGKDYVKSIQNEIIIALGENKPKFPTKTNVSINLVYYYSDGRKEHDIDNILKPIQDSLIGTVLIDDRQIVEYNKLSKIRTGYNGFMMEIFSKE